MSTFGQYVHLHWKNYRRAGTYHVTNNWDASSTTKTSLTKSNYRSSIFMSHRLAIFTSAAHYSVPDIKKLEDKYNQYNQMMIARLKKIITNQNAKNYDFLEQLMFLVSSTWRENAEVLAKNLKINDAGRVSFNSANGAVGVFHGKTIDSSTSGLFKKLSKTQKINVIQFLKQIDSLKKALMKLFSDNFSVVKKEYDQLTNLETVVLNWKDQQSTVNLPTDHLDPQNNIEIITSIITPFNTIVDQYTSAASINKILYWRLPEILGDISTKGLAYVKQDTLKSVVEHWLSTGQKQTVAANKGFKMTAHITQASLKELHDEQSSLSGAVQVVKTKNGKVMYKLKSSRGTVEQKADLEWIVDTVDNQEPIGISLKTTDLSRISKKYPNIQAQSSKLSLFLEGFERDSDHLGTHYLNIFADHKDKNTGDTSQYDKVKKSATRSLRLALAYSALSGVSQGRKGGFAHMLAIYDSSTGKVKFYDVYTILKDLDANIKDLITISPAVEDLVLKNDEVAAQGQSTYYRRQAVNKRITRLIAETKTKTITVGLSKQWFKKH